MLKEKKIQKTGRHRLRTSYFVLRTSYFVLCTSCIAYCLLTLNSCKGFLDKQPLGILDANAFFSNATDAVQAVNAAYSQLTFASSNNNYYWVFGVVASDEAIAGGDGSRPGIVDLDAMQQTPRTTELNNFWALNYDGINQCNVVLDRINSAPIDTALRNRIRGEALFLRSYYHFILAQTFGDIPSITSVLSPDQLRVPRTPVADVFKQIATDCDAAATLLPTTYDPTNIGRATKGAALALAAKAELYLKDWNKTLDYVAKVKALGIYKLMKDYRDNFLDSTKNNAESVWAIQHTSLQLNVGNSINQWWASKKIPNGYGFCEVTPQFVVAFEPGDPRLHYTVAQNREDYFGVIYRTSYSSTGYGARKYLQPDSQVKAKADGSINYVAIRYAEVLLWEAEAKTELGATADALIPLEAVRARARAQSGDTTKTVLPAITTTVQADLRTAIHHERQVELGFEMHRFFDLVRWGQAKQYIPEFTVGKNEVFPIPQTERDLNPMLTQNPGY